VSEQLSVTGPAVPTGAWRTAVVREVQRSVRPPAVVLRLEVPDRIDHLPGQHYVVRLTADDGYVAQRSYSLASSPDDPLIELYVERLDDGEVSTFLADVVEVGDELAVRGPIGGFFVWDATTPALGVGGGSGVVPLVAMLRHAQALGRADLLELVVAARTVSVLPYARELRDGGATTAFSRVGSPGGRPAGHLTVDDLTPLLDGGPTVFVCGSSGFAEAASQLLVEAGVATPSIRVERFGPSGVPSS
jgi:ferredoxin-NADP reductase